MIRNFSLLIFALALASCTRSLNYQKTNPVYEKRQLLGSEKVGVLQFDSTFFFTAPARVSGWMNITEVDYNTNFQTWFIENFTKVFKEQSKMPLLPVKEPWEPRFEKIQLDSNIFINALLPAQGEYLVGLNSEKVRFLWVIHESVLGPFANANQLFDLQLSQQESKTEISSKPKIGWVVSYSLWDNQNQQYLHHGVAESQLPFSGALEKKIIDQLILENCQKILRSAPWGK